MMIVFSVVFVKEREMGTRYLVVETATIVTGYVRLEDIGISKAQFVMELNDQISSDESSIEPIYEGFLFFIRIKTPEAWLDSHEDNTGLRGELEREMDILFRDIHRDFSTSPDVPSDLPSLVVLEPLMITMALACNNLPVK
jgi:hypothetical protein